MKRFLLLLLLIATSASADMDVRLALNWVAPTENRDGSPLTDLAGYRAYWGYAPGDYQASVTIDDAAATSATVTPVGVPSGATIYVVLTAFDVDGNESAHSNQVFFGPFIEEPDTAVDVVITWPNPPSEIGATARIVRCGTAECRIK